MPHDSKKNHNPDNNRGTSDSQNPPDLQTENRQLRKQVYQLRNLLKVSADLNANLQEGELIHSYIMNLFGLLSAKSVVVLTEELVGSKTFTPTQYRGITKQEANGLKVSSTDGVFSAISLRKPFFSITDHNAHSVSEFVATVSKIGGRIIAPVMHEKEPLGLVIIGDKHQEKAFTETDIEIIDGLTNFLAIGIINARLYHEKEHMSVTDPLTGLFNRRHFEDSLKKELARARRFHHPLSLVILDVDHFKNYNDQLGHTSGDVLLKHMADLLTNTVRCSDTIARYGGEEFCIILPELPSPEAVRFSERIRKVIFSHPFENREIQPRGHITISLGTATYPGDANYMKDLIVKADSALYHAKKLGRNQVAVYRAIGNTTGKNRERLHH